MPARHKQVELNNFIGRNRKGQRHLCALAEGQRKFTNKIHWYNHLGEQPSNISNAEDSVPLT